FADFRVPANRSVSDRPGSSLSQLPGSAELRADTLLWPPRSTHHDADGVHCPSPPNRANS
ncbi:MAG: hypothetical protein ACI8P0_004507, partial [Planctomycetaceae bacterium]